MLWLKSILFFSILFSFFNFSDKKLKVKYFEGLHSNLAPFQSQALLPPFSYSAFKHRSNKGWNGLFLSSSFSFHSQESSPSFLNLSQLLSNLDLLPGPLFGKEKRGPLFRPTHFKTHTRGQRPIFYQPPMPYPSSEFMILRQRRSGKYVDYLSSYLVFL